MSQTDFQPTGVTVYQPGHKEYELSVATSNLLYRFTRPPWVVKPKTTQEVEKIITEAQKNNLSIAIKNGGHSGAGFSTTEQGVLVDLVNMNNVQLDMQSREPTATMGGGAKWGHAYRKLVNGRHDGWVINGGRCPTVGVSGFVLGAGLCPFGRSIGMGCDRVTEITIVVPGKGAREAAKTLTLKRGDTDANKRELFWALCGAGGGNFGIVTEVKMNVDNLGSLTVVAGRFIYQPRREDMADFMEMMNEFYTAKWSNEMTIDSSWLCDLNQTNSELAVRFIAYYKGNKGDFDREIDEKLVIGADVGKLLKRRSSEEKSTRFLHETLVSQWSEETIQSLPSSRTYSIYTSFVFSNDNKDQQIKKITSIIRKEMKAFRTQFTGEQGLLQVTFLHSGGKAAEGPSTATAYPWRKGVYHTYITMQWEDKWLKRDMQGFLAKFKKRLRPYSLCKEAVFINFADRELEADKYEAAYYGLHVARLKGIKKYWDLTNFFKWQQGITLPEETSPDQTMARSLNEFARMEPKVKEEVLTQAEEDRQWDKVSLPPASDFTGDIPLPWGVTIGSGIKSLHDLGF
ncbi:hypothetical protein EYZ11_002254 [Aspergillus tanneri]|uniref:FAD-binding PCMH-type domain-containing protein n=1 Tax=Aspergillus tanneri TaxID=1220188 RepID=A0A4S3JRA7_9EURO|nr:uncharacterized protein ATNIH1004_001916 [Aspergillus tanneri]KAA8641451.1 hypothetical protein ATNIH1004_001916 [Aspergillus tanneri]THC98252.1 hypothetical protein EYZ11_002254 [Aspergillus tanneri]